MTDGTTPEQAGRKLREYAIHGRRGTVAAAFTANLIGASVVAIYVTLLSPGGAPEDFRFGEAVALFTVYMAISLPGGNAIVRRWERDLFRAMAQGRALDRRQRTALINTPARSATVTLGMWAAAAVVFATYFSLRYEPGAEQVLGLGLTILLGGFTTTALIFLLNERRLRGMYAVTFGEEPPARAQGVGVRWRLTLSWVLGAAVPLLGLAVALLGVGPGNLGTLQRAVLTLVLVGLVAGYLITLRAARSVAEPLEDLRDAVDRVRGGDLDVAVPVDDVTEIGLLQSGFNQMVAGLRQRAELEDLFGRHVGVEVAREALRRGVGLGGERREVSAMFIDLVGSTELATRRPPEEVVEIVNAVFGAVVYATSREGGWVNKFEGDAALCVFGAPLEQADHAARALRAAVALRAELLRLAVRHPGVDAGIGVSSGIAVAGNVGAEDRYEYTVIGDPVNEAARLTEEAKSRPGRVLASGPTVERGGPEAAQWQVAASLQLRGRPDHTVAYEPAADVEDVTGDVADHPAVRAS